MNSTPMRVPISGKRFTGRLPCSGAASPQENHVERIKRLHQEIADAVIARDRERARTQMARYIAGINAWLE